MYENKWCSKVYNNLGNFKSNVKGTMCDLLQQVPKLEYYHYLIKFYCV